VSNILKYFDIKNEGRREIPAIVCNFQKLRELDTLNKTPPGATMRVIGIV
jgi:hypothetical protein